ncbi:hypothetical protein RG963_12755 [Methanosarcina sp. Z-7115]|uniref:Glycerophosphoryl diester phosphodiesterase membrane domain-containing protein n=1 Tax=Methanosarcina baikalica TaxID=3073890 RepID=A0ABU2D3S4_9EURY|nr:hypothetical protein [Methanosarcina sp. Z-7115]MDR7666630.1 hypothetical protein [Methanosarcina sp. Z-7115]
MSWYAIDAVDRAFSRTRKALFEPFDFWKWAKLAIIILLLGGIGSSYGGSGTNYRMGPEDFNNNFPNIEPGRMPVFPFGSNEIGLSYIQSVSPSAIIITAIVFILLLALIFLYISSVMEFVFVESLVRNEVKFWNYSRRFLGKGFYLLLVRLALGLVFLALLGIAALPFIPGILKRPSDFALPAVVGGIFWIVGVIFVLILVVGAISSFLSLAIPLSIYRKTGILSAFGLVFANFRKSWQEIVVYWFTRFLLGIGIAILTVFLFGIVLLVLGLVFLVTDGILYFLFSSLLSDPLSWILLIPFVLIELALIFGTLLFLGVPLTVFLKYHLLSFLETWFVGAEIPFFDASVQEPETEFNEPESAL